MTELVFISDILVKDAKLEAVVLPETERILEMIEETQQQQVEVLKLKSIDSDSLKMVVQL